MKLTKFILKTLEVILFILIGLVGLYLMVYYRDTFNVLGIVAGAFLVLLFNTWLVHRIVKDIIGVDWLQERKGGGENGL